VLKVLKEVQGHKELQGLQEAKVDREVLVHKEDQALLELEVR
jgi:hypothetical protein